MTASGTPTATVSPSGTRISRTTPATGEGTSESTLSVETSKSGSSTATGSPGRFSQRVIVPSVTVSPSWGIGISMRVPPLLAQGQCSDRPVSASAASPNTSDNVGWGWINPPISAGVASQFTAR